MEEGYWCHMCSQRVNPIREVETIKCPICQSGFIEEMASDIETDSDSVSDRALSLWAPILLGMMDNPRRRLTEGEGVGDDYELESIMRRRRSSATILQLLQGMRAGIASDQSERERVTLINPFNQTIIVQGESMNRAPIGSLSDYFIGPGLDLLLQHLSENDPNRYGTPPAQKEAVETLATVNVEEKLQCSVCLDECEIGDQVKEMPCKHKFHSTCILPWLELHSSCPVCRYQLPCDDSKLDSENANANANTGSRDDERGRQFSVPLPWPFSSLFRSSTAGTGGSSTSSGSSQLN